MGNANEKTTKIHTQKRKGNLNTTLKMVIKPQENPNKPQTIKETAIGTYISIITLKVKGLNSPTKRHRLVEWTQKQDLCIHCL